MRRFLCFWVSWVVLGCSGKQFTTAARDGVGDGGPAAGGGSNAGGTTGTGGRGNGGSKAGGTTGVGGANAGGVNAGGAISNGGAVGSGGAVGNGGASAGGAVGNGGASAGGVMGSGGVSAGGVMGNGGVSAGGVMGNGGATTTQSGDCALGADDCRNGTNCVEVTPGGYRVCAVKYPEANGCTPGGGCCQTSDCQGGRICYPSPLAPTCGGIVILDGNVCASDTCTSDSDCGATAICAPAGTFQRKVAMCVSAGCRHDTDCTLSPGGICAPVSGGCCDNPYGLYCVYPNKSCRSNADCQSANCALDPQGFSVCSTDPIICPL